ncbi:MAG: AtpZ/AtpI family protein [Acidobacteriota bacterium]|nr:MAG: AtpZ/AtpI family protein [Acidobacteriota bacterium]
MAGKDYYRRLALYSGIVFILPTTIVGLFLFGQYLDSRFETEPYLAILGFFVGVAVAGLELYRIIGAGEAGKK